MMGDVAEDLSLFGRILEEAGWRQCALFRPSQAITDSLPSYMEFDPERDLLMVATQSCSVCAPKLDTFPTVEVIACRLLAKYKSSHPAAVGRHTREVHLPILGGGAWTGVSCAILRRAFIPRVQLLDVEISEISIRPQDVRSFQGWIARFYSRIAMPQALVNRLRADGGIGNLVRAALQRSLDGKPAHLGVEAFFVQWDPDRELPANENYNLHLIIACRDESTEDFLDSEIGDLASGHGYPEKGGILMPKPLIQPIDLITMSQIAGHSRFTEWDELSDLEEHARYARAT